MPEENIEIRPIKTSDKITQILSALQNYIIDNDLEPGTEIPSERELAGKLGVSRFSLREALRAAQVQGLIEINRGRRPRVAEPSAGAAVEIIALTLRRSKKAMLDLVVARHGLESQIAQLAAAGADDETVTAMQASIDVMEANKKNFELCVEKDVEFHRLLVDSTNNLILKIMTSSIELLLRKSRRMTMRLMTVERAITGHKEIIDAVRRRDPEMAYNAMQKHLDMAEEDVKKILDSLDE